MNHQEVSQRLFDRIISAVGEALNANVGFSSKQAAGVILGAGVGALKVEGVSKKDLLSEVEKCFDGTINHGPLGRGGSA